MTGARRDSDPDGVADILAALRKLGLVGTDERPAFTALSGGVSSDIWRVDTAAGAICVKRARARLAVEAVWEVPVERNRYEAEFLRVADAEVPGLAPPLLAEDRAAGLLAMPYLDPAAWRLWKAELLAGRVDVAAAARMGTALGALQARTRGRADLAARFPTDELFHALRLDPYLGECARRHPDLAPILQRLIADSAGMRAVLVHGDVSPKNILLGPGGALRLLDAECAWYGDPAFDPAFLLNHFLLKTVHLPAAADALRAAFGAFLAAYAPACADAEPARHLARVARLLPGLFLARVDGKSPVEYLTRPDRIALVRRLARRFLAEPADHPEAIADAVLGEARR